MVILLTIFQYLIQSTVDLMDKFLISTRKIEPVNYTFYTVVMGLALLVLWPWNYVDASAKVISLDLLSGAAFSLAMYVFFKALAQGEVSRVIPFIFGLVPIFDITIGLLTGHNSLKLNEFAAALVLIPGALLVSHHKGDNWAKHAGLKTLSAFLFSLYYAIWQFASASAISSANTTTLNNQIILNNLMWNRVGAALILILLLAIPTYRKKVFTFTDVKNKKQTSFIFIFKQILGGLNFVFLSFLYVIGKISVINALQGFRYVFLLLFAMFITKHRGHILKEDHDKSIFTQKSVGIILIFLGTALLFL